MEDIVRVGMVSSVENGMVRVYYPDREETTASLHLFAGNGEYSLPQVNDQVIVLHLSNDTSTAVVLGSFWSKQILFLRIQSFIRILEKMPLYLSRIAVA